MNKKIITIKIENGIVYEVNFKGIDSNEIEVEVWDYDLDGKSYFELCKDADGNNYTLDFSADITQD